ncbi:MAG TPA: SprT-like domain-containing protein [Tepidisphaeraceae bacterium]|jgi:predicted SprT family Zn-dependent metalloprotease
MNLNSAKALSLRLMGKHGLVDQGWQFRWNNNARRAGVCRIKRTRLTAPVALVVGHSVADAIEHKLEKKYIELSRFWTKHHEKEMVLETILHEIAHALAGPEAHHGPVWKRIARGIGATPRSCFRSLGLPKQPLYTVVCPNCSWSLPRYKLPRVWRRRQCGKCHDWPVIFNHRRKVHFHFIVYSSLASRRMLSKKELLPRLGRRLRLPTMASALNGS